MHVEVIKVDNYGRIAMTVDEIKEALDRAYEAGYSDGQSVNSCINPSITLTSGGITIARNNGGESHE